MMDENIFALAYYADQFILIVLISLSVLSFAIILERFFFLKGIDRDSKEVLAMIEASLQKKKSPQLLSIAGMDKSFYGAIAKSAVDHIHQHGENGLDEVFNSFAIVIRPKLDRFLSFLGTIGSNAPYVGLLGTVLGIMKAFHDMTHATSDGGQKVVMAGISMALVATAAGLTVAIPSVAFYNFYHKKVQSIFNTLGALKELSLSIAKSERSSL
jgi:biopolymer transport protein TolQ